MLYLYDVVQTDSPHEYRTVHSRFIYRIASLINDQAQWGTGKIPVSPYSCIIIFFSR